MATIPIMIISHHAAAGPLFQIQKSLNALLLLDAHLYAAQAKQYYTFLAPAPKEIPFVAIMEGANANDLHVCVHGYCPQPGYSTSS
jgi:hypothetical protein